MRKRIILLSTFGALLVLWGCSKFNAGKFVSPAWDTQFSAPLFLLVHIHCTRSFIKTRPASPAGIPPSCTSRRPRIFIQFPGPRQSKVFPSGTICRYKLVSRRVPHKVRDITVNSPDSINYTVPYPNGASQGTVLTPWSHQYPQRRSIRDLTANSQNISRLLSATVSFVSQFTMAIRQL